MFRKYSATISVSFPFHPTFLIQTFKMKKKLKKIGGLILMFVLGVMWILSGWYGIIRPDRPGHLESILVEVISSGKTIPFYKPFLEAVVIPNKTLFAGLVAWGEFLVGLSFLSGTMVRFSSIAAMFMLLNYGLMNGAFFQHLIIIVLQMTVFLAMPGRYFGGDRLLAKRWPDSNWF